MIVLVLPVSGGYFPHQIKSLIELCNYNIEPHLIFSSSGGNVAAYVAEVANFRSNNITRLISELNSDLFISKHSEIPTFDSITSFFKGALYSSSEKLEQILRKYNNQETIIRHEIWTGTFNRTTQKALLFCNQSEENTILTGKDFNHTLFQTDEPVYMDGNINLISKIILASASIPTYIVPQKYKNYELIDGGIAYASPITIFKNKLQSCFENQPGHVFYLNGFDLADKEEASNKNIIQNGRLATIEMTKFNICKDRQAAYETVFGSQILDYVDYDITELPKIITSIKSGKYRASLTEIYPILGKELDVLKFLGSDVQNIMDQTTLAIRFWSQK